MRRLPEWLRHDDHNVDRILIAGWALLDGDYEVGRAIARSAAGGVLGGTREDLQVQAEVDRVVELIGQYLQVDADPKHYIDLYGAERGPGCSLAEWAEGECAEILAEIREHAGCAVAIGQLVAA